MKILLLFPGWTGEYGLFSHFAKKASTWPPLNLAYLAALADRKKHQVKIIDAEAEGLSLKQILGETKVFTPDIIGITATTPFFHIATELAYGLKQQDCSLPIIIGGPHITVLKEKAFEPCFDYAFVGESEESWVKFLEYHEYGKNISNLKGLLYRADNNIYFTGMPEPINDLDSIPFPARHLLHNDQYNIGTLHGRKNFTTIMTTRGCPFKCIFCSTEVFGNRSIRKRSAQSVVDEIKLIISEFGIRHFIFLDDTLTLDRNYILEICLKIKKEKLSLTFEGSTRANLIDEELISLMKSSGLIRISFGLETVDPVMRATIKKEAPLESYAIANRLTNKYGIETLNSVMLGLPGETRRTIEKTLSYLRNAREIHQSNFSIATPYPGTEFYEMAKRGECGIRLLTDDFSRYRRYGSAVISVNDLSATDLIHLQNDGFVSIYSAPWRIIPMLKKNGILGGLLMIVRLLGYIKRRLFSKRSVYG